MGLFIWWWAGNNAVNANGGNHVIKKKTLWYPLIIRITVGLVFIVHGFSKFQPMQVPPQMRPALIEMGVIEEDAPEDTEVLSLYGISVASLSWTEPLPGDEPELEAPEDPEPSADDAAADETESPDEGAPEAEAAAAEQDDTEKPAAPAPKRAFALPYNPMPWANGWFAASAELVCGFLVLIGLFTRLASIPLIFAMFIAITMVHWTGWNIFDPAWQARFGGWEFAGVMFACSLAILLGGPGLLSADHALFGRKKHVPEADEATQGPDYDPNNPPPVVSTPPGKSVPTSA